MEYDEATAMSQGWVLANDSERGLEIQRYDADPSRRFWSDAHALLYVQQRAIQGDGLAKYCMVQIKSKG